MGELKAVVLAAGKGTRLASELSDMPKVMRLANGRPLLDYVLENIGFVGRGQVILVVGYKREKVLEAFPDCRYAIQEPQLGTGHAAACAAPLLAGFSGDVLICYGDMPLLRRETYEALYAQHVEQGNACTVLSGRYEEEMAYGRIVRDADGAFLCIVEQRDCNGQERAIREYNSGVYIFKAPALLRALQELNCDNAQGEYYLTDAPAIIRESGGKVGLCERRLGDELVGVNTPEQLRQVGQLLAQRG